MLIICILCMYVLIIIFLCCLVINIPAKFFTRLPSALLRCWPDSKFLNELGFRLSVTTLLDSNATIQVTRAQLKEVLQAQACMRV